MIRCSTQWLSVAYFRIKMTYTSMVDESVNQSLFYRAPKKLTRDLGVPHTLVAIFWCDSAVKTPDFWSYSLSANPDKKRLWSKWTSPPFFRLLWQGALSYYAVFDGHGGSDAAKYAAVHLHSLLGRRLQTQSPKEALHEAFLETDRMFVTRANREVTQCLL